VAAPTNVYSEAVGIGTIVIYWLYSGSNPLQIYRSTNGVDFAEITFVPTSFRTFDDSGLLKGTKYYHKLSDDNGSTFSDVVSATTHICAENGNLVENELALPRMFTGGDPSIEFNELALKVEAAFKRTVLNESGTCNACITDRTLVIDCQSGCRNFNVLTDQDINSISVINCDQIEDGTISFVVPPNATRRIGGWPRGFGFTGNESSVSGGDGGRVIIEKVGDGLNVNQQSGRSRPGTQTEGGGQSGGQESSTTPDGSPCECLPTTSGGLRIQSCGSNNTSGSLGCSGANPQLNLVACGGNGPYTWTFTGDINIVSGGNRAAIIPPTNAGSAVAGVAYTKNLGFYNTACSVCNTFTFGGGSCGAQYNCDDSLVGGDCGLGGALCDHNCDNPVCSVTPCNTGGAGCQCDTCSGTVSSACTEIQARGTIRDTRTAGMTAAGCNPCGLAVTGATATVTDALGVSTTLILKA
jgi:hypothetical protein